MKVNIALADDHVLLRNGLANLLKEKSYNVLFEADNGKQFIEKIDKAVLPHVVLMDINMPQMNGYEATLWLKKNHPSVKIVVLSMLDDENSVIRMFKSGAHGYVLKDCHPDELQLAIKDVLEKGFYYSDAIGGKLTHALNHLDDKTKKKSLEPDDLATKELEFLKWTCTELGYKEIAEKMGVSPRTVDNYRDTLQEKLECKGRIGLAIWAIKHGVVTI